MYKGRSVAVVMPIHNEEPCVERAIARVPDFVDLIIAVDDGSDDGTWEILSRISNERLVLLRHASNRGVGAATKTGYRCALKSRADLIAVMDGDGQMDGRDLSSLLDCAIEGADYVKGNRFLDRESVGCMPRLRYIGNRFLSELTRRAAGFGASLDAHCGYTVIGSRALQRLPLDELYDRYGFPTEMFFAARAAGFRVECAAVKTIYGDEVSGINPITAVPMVLYLIARNYLRACLGPSTCPTARFSSANADPAEYHLEA